MSETCREAFFPAAISAAAAARERYGNDRAALQPASRARTLVNAQSNRRSLRGVGVAVYYGGGSVGDFDGRSWSSPCFVALLADAIEVNHGSRFGFVNPTIYSVFKASSYNDFTDVTAGTNGYYQTMSNYDQVTGIGAPKATRSRKLYIASSTVQ